MLRDRYAPRDVLAVVPQGALALEPELQELDRLLEDDEIVKRVRADLVRRYPYTASRGRSSTPVEVILRLLIVKRLYGWSYENTERFVSDSLGLRRAEGLKPLDALHLASAVTAKADYFCTCDERLLKRAKTMDTEQTKVVSPLELIAEVTQ